MKMKKWFGKAAAMVLAAVTLLSSMFVTPAFAATGDIGTITFDYVYDSAGNPIYYNSGAVINGHSAGGTGKMKVRMFVDGDTAFCIQPGVPLSTGDTLKESSSETWNALSSEQKKAVGLALLYGYQGNRSKLSGSDGEKWLATQTLVWEFVIGCRNSSGNYKQVDTTAYSLHFGSNYPNSGAEAVYEQIVSMMTHHNVIPSFMSGSTSAAAKEMKYSDGKYVLTLTDTNGVLSEYNFSSSNSKVSISKSGNTLTLTSTDTITDSVRITAYRNNIPTVSESAKLIAYGSPDLQDVVTGVENTDPVYAYLNVETPAGSMALKKTSEDGKVAGISFSVSGNGINETVKTNDKGEFRLDNLVPGVYTVTELVENKYEPQEVQRVTVVGGQTATVSFSNVLKRGSLTVTKTSEDGLNEGVKFHLSGTSVSGIAVDEYAVTDSNGKAYFEDILMGSGYILEEVDTAVRYVVPDSQNAAVEWNKVTEKSFTNTLKKFCVTVTKSDKENGTAQADATLAGAIYGIYKGETLIDTYTTDANGQFTTAYYVCGDDWSVREIQPSEGYLLDETGYHVGAEATLYTVEYNAAANDVTEQIIKGNIALIKHTDDGETQIETPEEGAEFAVYLKSAGGYDSAAPSERDYLTCDENGFAQSKDLPYGIYTVQQTKGWDGREMMPPFDVYVAKDGQTYRFLVNNANFESYIKIVKVDAETGKVIPYAGAGFELYRPDGSQITQTFTYPEVTTVSVFYTNDDGYLITPETLEYGTGYSLVEVFAPYGYTLNADPVYFDVTEDTASEESGVTVVEVLKPNTAQKGIIRIEKTGEVFASVTETDGIYQPVYEMQKLSGAVYEVIAAADVVTPDGTVRYNAGDVVDTVTTNETGIAETKPLYLGSYEIHEVTAPEGMVLSDEIHSVVLSYAGQEIEITETSTSFVNERQKVSVTLEKTMEQDERFAIGTNNEISAVTFGLYADEELAASDGSVIPKDALLEIVSVNEGGIAECKSDLPMGSYYLRELSTDAHYILSDTKYPVVFAYAGQNTEVVDLSVNDGDAIKNKLIYGEIRGLKKDDSGNALSGAMIGLFSPETTEYTENTAIVTTVSNQDGSFVFKDIPYGCWVVREIQAPAGYVLSDKAFAVNIDKNGAVVEVEIENTLIRGTVQLTKTDKDYPENKLTGAEFKIWQDNGDKKLDENDAQLGTLTEVSVGIYEMSDLVYGGYFVKETKAPQGFYADENAYYFEITDNGKTVTVENEAGLGFINEAQVGSLKIIKTSSDKKVSGFSFRVMGPNGYSKVFTTDKNGEILIENLRIGDYTVSEVSDSASAAYVLPADKDASVFEGAVTKVEMHNELRDTPKTGDDSNPMLWAVIMGVSAAGAIVLGVTAFRKRKKEDK